MLDKNDKKYIIRRIITYIAIAMIMFIISSCQAHAMEICMQNTWLNSDYVSTQSSNTINFVYGRWLNSCGNNVTLQIPVMFSQSSSNSNPNVPSSVWRLELGDGQTYYGELKNGFIEFTGINPNKVNSNGYIKSIYYSTYMYDISSISISKYFQAFSDTSSAQAINEINQNITDSTPPTNNEISGNTSDWNSYNSDNGVINNLVLMPVTLLNSFVNGMNNSCSSYDLGELWGEHIILPCIDLSQMLGAVWSIIDIILSGVFIFVFGKQCVKIFNDFTNLRSGQIDTLYGGGN